MYVFGEDNFEIILEHNKQRLSILMLKYLRCSFLLAQVQSSLSPVIISTLTVIFSLKTISRLSIRLSLIVDNGGLGRGAVGRCRQIRIWLHRAGRARSQKREMKFDRSDRDPLALRSSILVSNPPPSPQRPRLGPSRSSRHPVATSRAAKWRWHTRPPGFHTFGVPHGHRRRPAPPSLAHVVPPLPPSLPRSLAAHPILYDSLLSVTSPPPPPPPPPVMLPRGHPLKRVSLVPTRHLFTNTSHGLLAPCRVSPRAPPYRIAVPS